MSDQWIKDLHNDHKLALAEIERLKNQIANDVIFKALREEIERLTVETAKLRAKIDRLREANAGLAVVVILTVFVVASSIWADYWYDHGAQAGMGIRPVHSALLLPDVPGEHQERLDR